MWQKAGIFILFLVKMLCLYDLGYCLHSESPYYLYGIKQNGNRALKLLFLEQCLSKTHPQSLLMLPN